ncbi:hypothetical protein V9T40_003910 [Parthenolecanium corni]|uniref:Protein farnesyltransferase subunit beta n=1 Tax=Parthenolecanium corni TaxID=536013 RepID=A0AAN9TS85_9HEMI
MDCLKVKRIRNCDEGNPTKTTTEQDKVEDVVDRLFNMFIKKSKIDPDAPLLLRKEHILYLKQSLTYLPAAYACLDSSRPWMCYWICHSLALLDYQLDSGMKSHIAKFLDKCQSSQGGFGGGPGQAPHLASTYAAVQALCCLGTEEAFEVINREKLKSFLMSTKCSTGAFSLEVDGEVDIRGAYCAAAVATITNLNTDVLFEKTAAWILSCQTYEGGFAGYPGLEAHGGYTFCGVAALTLLNSVYLCDTKALLRWCTNRQMRFEGGFQGRTNKLVDGCYSFWQGGVFPIIYEMLNGEVGESVVLDEHLFSNKALQEYILICCQAPFGGLIDKPEKARDIYHTCYTLSGLSVAQHLPNGKADIVGDETNLLMPTHPLYNIEKNCLKKAVAYFSSKTKL